VSQLGIRDFFWIDLSDCEMGEAAKWIELYGYMGEYGLILKLFVQLL
jgi:hypothetical protein